MLWKSFSLFCIVLTVLWVTFCLCSKSLVSSYELELYIFWESYFGMLKCGKLNAEW